MLGEGLKVDPAIPDKTYFRIGEVARLLGVETHVLRYWESEFRTVRPVRTRTDQRLYRRQDVEELLRIRKLLYEERFTLDGAKRQIARLRREGEPAGGEDEHERLRRIKEGLLELKRIMD